MGRSVTLFFPGQGSQYPGMGRSPENGETLPVLAEADRILGAPLSEIMLSGPEEELRSTANAQPAVLAHSVGLLRLLEGRLERLGAGVERALGHSVGEYAALVAAGALDFAEALVAVRRRGEYMRDAAPPGGGKMVAVLRAPVEEVCRACALSGREDGQAVVANYNGPAQTVISGESKACDRAVEWLAKNASVPHRAVELKVSAPFHSHLMRPAAGRLGEVLEGMSSWRAPKFPYVANVDAREYGGGTAPETLRENLRRQVEAPVLWTRSVSALPHGTRGIEVGPGSVLSGMVRKINPGVRMLPLDGKGSLGKLEGFLRGD